MQLIACETSSPILILPVSVKKTIKMLKLENRKNYLARTYCLHVEGKNI